jgi:hypothetical protein
MHEGFACVLFAASMSCASHDHAPTASGDGTTAPHGPELPTVGDYPPGPYGYSVGEVFPRLQISGYLGGAPPWVLIDLKTYFDPTGSHGVHGIYLTVSAPWCSGCKAEGQDLPALFSGQYKARGARIMTVLLQGAAYEPASQGTVDAWVAAYHTPYDMGIGTPDMMLPAKGSTAVALPYNYAINPRTMRIAAIDSGDYFHGDTLPALNVVLAGNGH